MHPLNQLGGLSVRMQLETQAAQLSVVEVGKNSSNIIEEHIREFSPKVITEI
jgi:hypothetical protein